MATGDKRKLLIGAVPVTVVEQSDGSFGLQIAGTIQAPPNAAYYDESGNALTVRRIGVNIATGQTDSVIVAAVTGKKIRVVALVMVAGALATDVTFNTKGGGAGAAVTPLFSNAGHGGAVLPENRLGWFETITGEALTATTGAGGSTTGILVDYVEV